MEVEAAEPVAGPEWPTRSDLNGWLIGGRPVSLTFAELKWMLTIKRFFWLSTSRSSGRGHTTP